MGSDTNNNKIYASVSLVFKNNNKILICNEYRKKKLLYNPIGGKVEIDDKDLLYTGIREFIEETNLENNQDFNNLCKNFIDTNTKESMIEYIYKLIQTNCIFKDICVSINNNKHHRYYTVELNSINNELFKNILINLPEFYNNNKLKDHSVIDLLWIENDENVEYNYHILMYKYFFN